MSRKLIASKKARKTPARGDGWGVLYAGHRVRGPFPKERSSSSRVPTACPLEPTFLRVELLDGRKGAIRFSEHLDGGGEALFRQACKLELEGLVSKRKDATYHSGRSPDWTKRTCRQRETFMIAGITSR